SVRRWSGKLQSHFARKLVLKTLQLHQNHIARVTVPYLSWPMDLETKLITLSSRYLPKRSDVSITVTVDKDNQTPEIYERKNTTTRRFYFDMAELTCQEGPQAGLAVMSPPKSSAGGFNCL
ncbi:MAG: hypothetical protein VYE00_00680, partial [Candidatus Poribacteria bacterium]|nr:hypothetical protein [Candidatus Poribacteria bacterium]